VIQLQEKHISNKKKPAYRGKIKKRTEHTYEVLS